MPASPSVPPAERHAVAQSLLDRAESAFDTVLQAVARRCLRDGRLDGERLDAQQPAAFELAWARAELAAARAALQAGAAAVDGLDARLARAFVAEALGNVRQRLEAVADEAEVDGQPLQALTVGAESRLLRAADGGHAALAELGRALLDSPHEIGAVALDDELVMAQDSFRRFAAEVVAPAAEAIHREDLTVPESLLQPMREMGVFGLGIPEAYGGSASGGAGDALLMIAVTEALSEASLAAAGSLITRPEILARALLAGGTEAQKRDWLPRLAAGDPLCAIAITEPDHGSDVASLTLKASRVDGGWRLDGAKTWCTFAGKAGLLMVVARTDPDRRAGHRGLSLLLVEKPSDDAHAFEHVQPGGGRLAGRAIPTIGYRGMHSFDLAFEGWFVPDSHLIGEAGGVGQGFYLTMAGMTGGRMQTAARASGVMAAALKAALRYAQDRRVFGAPLASFALTQVKLARMAARYAACRQLTYGVGRQLDAAEGAQASLQASLAKLLACRSAEIVTREAQQLHGGMGYAEEMAVSRYFVDARVLSIFEGAEETLALKVIARGLLAQASGLGSSGG